MSFGILGVLDALIMYRHARNTWLVHRFWRVIAEAAQAESHALQSQ